jgi:predicted Ser/Thr protein kinase
MSLENVNECEQCGGPLTPAGLLAGSCPRCMMAFGADTNAPVPADPDSTLPSDVANTSVRDAAYARPAVIGRYRVLRLVGEGGMGVVYEAQQDHPRRTVALKVIKPGLVSPELVRRFDQESHALGRLQHPGIAQIYEAGMADTGFGPQPYFAMEFIHGANVTEYAEKHQLKTRQRLEILVKIADAVQHAHQRGLIHRDLKPANILIDESGQPKVLDFGVARATDSDAKATSLTDVGQLVGTLAYMSPEQVLADPLGLDTRSDVYALGVILYELLAGRLPYTVSEKLHEAIHSIREEDPSKLSAVSRSYRGDIETIVAKALEKDKTRRYGSAAEFAADITRYLKDEPIVARPPSAGYQLRKFARRHTAFVAGVAAVFVVLVAGTVVSTWQAQEARRERDHAREAELKASAELDRANLKAEREQARAESENKLALDAEGRTKPPLDNALSEKRRADTEAEIARAAQDFLGRDLLQMADPHAQSRLLNPNQPAAPSSSPNPNITVKELLDHASSRIGGKFDKKPLVEAAIREFIGDTYFRMGVYVEAQQHFQRAFALRLRDRRVLAVVSIKTEPCYGVFYETQSVVPHR